MERINELDLNEVSGGSDIYGDNGWRPATPCVRTGYLAIRRQPTYDDSNELGAIYNGEIFNVNMNKWNKNYIWASYNGTQGWVNSDYLTLL